MIGVDLMQYEINMKIIDQIRVLGKVQKAVPFYRDLLKPVVWKYRPSPAATRQTAASNHFIAKYSSQGLLTQVYLCLIAKKMW